MASKGGNEKKEGNERIKCNLILSIKPYWVVNVKKRTHSKMKAKRAILIIVAVVT